MCKETDADAEASAFARALQREREEFPRSDVERLIKMPPGLGRSRLALRLLPALIRMAASTLARRWQKPSTPPLRGYIVTVHALAPGGGFLQGWYSEGKWWTDDYVDDGTTWGTYKPREIEVVGWRVTEGSMAEPWHDQ